MKKKKNPLGKLLLILVIAFFYLPILYMIVFSFNDGKSLTSFTGFSLRWYRHMLESGDMMEALYTTFSVALIATFVSTVAGTISAIGLSKSKKIIRNLVEQVNNFPMMNPEIVTAIGFMLLFITFRIEKGYMALLLAHIAFCIPYVMLSVMPKIRSLDPNLADAAMDLGATPWQAAGKSYCTADCCRNHLRCSDCIYHVCRRLYYFLLCHRPGRKKPEYYGLHHE